MTDEFVYKYIRVPGLLSNEESVKKLLGSSVQLEMRSISYEKLLNHRITFSDISCFNDPFECNCNLILPDNYELSNKPKERENNFRMLKWELGGKIKEQCHREYRVACLTNRFDNPVMWSHYALVYYGICVAYKRSDILEAVGTQLLKAEKVKYCSETLSLSGIKLTKAFPKPRFTLTNDPINEEQLLNVMFTKAKDWEYEQEWRVAIKTIPEPICINEYLEEKDKNYLYCNINRDESGHSHRSYFKIKKYYEFSCIPHKIYFVGNPVKTDRFWDEIKSCIPNAEMIEMYPDTNEFKYSCSK
ncbi:DUF2971 domain-containing protein [Treponema primitia]|uniref:DUF2971 domain-containing protein n=1 Tax=Treponema primitia TaxID=88058 RepID=UPI00397FB13A